jgi:hypothetical protein
MQQFRKTCQTLATALVDGSSYEQYLAFENVTPKIVEDIDMWREDSNKNLPGMRLLYDKVAHILIVKLMAGAPHESAGRLFFTIWHSKLPRFSLRGMGGTRFEGGGQSKRR